MNTDKENLNFILRDLKNQLFDISKNSSLLYPTRQNGIYALDEITEEAEFKNLKLITSRFERERQISLVSALVPKTVLKLNNLRTSANREKQEFGQNSLKISPIQLSWYNELDTPAKWTKSPLYFLDVEIQKHEYFSIHGIQDHYKINPVLTSVLGKAYNISLPSKLPLKSQGLADNLEKIQEEIKSKTKVVADPLNTNPDSWKIHTHSSLIGDFNYQTGKLIHDFDAILSKSSLPPLLKTILTEQRNLQKSEVKSSFSLTDNHLISEIDPSQELLIQRALNGENLIVEGPPGTGKSQSISNLIACCLAEQKSVLFISSKKAALETVYKKLKAQNLAHSCAMIHDARKDKKAFIEDLQSSYAYHDKQAFNLEKLEAERKTQILHLNQAKKTLERYAKHMQTVTRPDSKIPVKALVSFLLVSKDQEHIKPSKIEADKLPNFSLFENFQDELQAINHFLKQDSSIETLSKHPVSALTHLAFLNHPDSDSLKSTMATQVRLWDALHTTSIKLKLPAELKTLQELQKFKQKFEPFLYFWKHEIQQSLENNSLENISLIKDAKRFYQLIETKNRLQKINQYWTKKISKEELQNALQIAYKYKETFAPILYKKYRWLKRQIKEGYSHHFLAKDYTDIELLQFLKEEYEVNEKLESLRQKLEVKYGSLSVYKIYKLIQTWQNEKAAKHKHLFKKLMGSDSSRHGTSQMFKILHEFDKASSMLTQHNEGEIEANKKTLIEVSNHFALIEKCYEKLNRIATKPEAFSYFTTTGFSYQEIKFNLYRIAYTSYLKNHLDFAEFNQHQFIEASTKLNMAKTNLFRLNATKINAKQNKAFKQDLRLASLSKKGLQEEKIKEQVDLKKGLSILENEFSKSRSFKSIRSLNEGSSKEFIQALKPVWLMSPRSVSDVLSLEPEQFDLVIFDEASQIRIEESIPVLYRAKRCVIAGDTMQLPPVDFFTKKLSSSKATRLSPSLLHHAKRSLPNLELKWHYRSQHEELISFNNAVFYNNSLKTIPEVKSYDESYPEVHIDQPSQAAHTYQGVREKPLSFHYVKNSLYSQGKNKKEAQYIAELVKHYLLSQQPLNIGILCPSLYQQEAIETALTKISYFEKGFVDLMNDKYENDENFNGIFIRNLENIQGEERDLIIVSMTYGPNEFQEIKRNFGPINQVGGEKRLNVLFSRAKKHLLIVSSLHSTDIEQSENAGVLCLKNYLHFAEQIHLGKKESVREFLQSFTPAQPSQTSWLNDFAQALRKHAYHVDVGHGFSSLKCDLAIKKHKDDETYLLGILADKSADYYQDNILHSYPFQSNLLEQYGWNIELVLAKDFLSNKELVIQGTIKRLKALQQDEEIVQIEEEQKSFTTTIDENKLLFTRLEKNEKEHLFWELAGNLHDIIIRYGKVGSSGSKLIKTYPSVAKVIEEKRKLIKQKEKQGYRRV